MTHLEPTYLRYIYDGLIKGSIHPENAAELPEGLIGLYEEAFDEKQPVHLRQQLLERFAFWALLKKEVSAQFVAEVLNQPEAEIQEFIATYSAWFNSPESGKYQLYHERLKVYLLQKLSEGGIIELNKRIIQFLSLQFSIIQKNESVLYCYQFLPHHAYVEAKINFDSTLLSELCLSDSFKKRQFDLSGFYDWEESLLQLGVEFFALKEDKICHKIVFEKTKIKFKKQDISLIISLIKSNELDTVFNFFRKFGHDELENRIELFFFYVIAFFEIFENTEWTFFQIKTYSSILLEVFETSFFWDNNTYWISSFVDVNISFRLHCYFIQFGLDYSVVAKHSKDYVNDTYDMDSYSELKFIGKEHRIEGNQILIQSKLYTYGVDAKKIKSLKVSDYTSTFSLNKTNILNKKIEESTKILLMQDLNCIAYDCNSFDEVMYLVKVALNKVEAPKYLKKKILEEYKSVLIYLSNGEISISGVLGTYDGNNTLGFVKNDLEQIKEERLSLSELLENGLDLEKFLSIDLRKRYQLLEDEQLNSDDDIELMLFFLDLSEHYQKEETSDLLNLLAALIIEFHLNINDDLIEKYKNQLVDLIESDFNESSEQFESNIFPQIVEFLGRNEVNSYRRKITSSIKDVLIKRYFDLNLYKDSFNSGCQLINLFSSLEMDFPEDEIVERILEDLNYLIESNDYNDLQEIDTSHIDKIHNKKYFTQFYSTIKKVPIEEFRLNLSKYVFDSIIDVKGLNHKTISYLKENSYEYPGMYLWAQKRLSLKLLEQNEFLSYVTIKDNNDLLLERLLLNIVSKRENLKDEFNIHILKYYGLDWVINLNNEYETLISL